MAVSALMLLIGVALWQLYSLAWGDSRSPYSVHRSPPFGGPEVPAVTINR